jgi:thioredoxin 1
MKTPLKLAIVAALAVTVVAAVVLKQKESKAPAETNAATVAAGTNAPAEGSVATAKLPMLRDLGAGKCIPCKMMKPILDDLKQNFAAQFVTEFIDVWENPDAGKAFGVEMIPTQIFYDAEGNELFRHTGFYGKEDILAKWKELGVDVTAKPAASQ